MEIQGYEFPLLDSEETRQYYDTSYQMLTAGVIGRKSKQNMALLGNETVSVFSYFEDEKYNTFYSQMMLLNHLGTCWGFVEKSDEVKSKFVDKSLNEWDISEDELGEIIAIIIKKDNPQVIRVKEELTLDESLKLLSACMATGLLWSSVCDNKLNTDLICGLYYETGEFLELIKDLKLGE